MCVSTRDEYRTSEQQEIGEGTGSGLAIAGKVVDALKCLLKFFPLQKTGSPQGFKLSGRK